MTPAIYGNAVTIVQAPGMVAISYEMVHDTRLIPVDGRPHLAAAMQQYMGTARGRWEGDTLVVETRGFTDKTAISGLRHSSALRLTYFSSGRSDTRLPGHHRRSRDVHQALDDGAPTDPTTRLPDVSL